MSDVNDIENSNASKSDVNDIENSDTSKSDVNKSDNSNTNRKGLVYTIASFVSLLVIATTIAVFQNSSDTTYTVDLQAYNDTKLECQHAEMGGETVVEMMNNLAKGNNVTAIFHQGTNNAYSFNKDGLEFINDFLCFNTFDGSQFCFDLAASGLSADDFLHPPAGNGYRQIQEIDDDDAIDDGDEQGSTLTLTLSFDFKTWFQILHRCLGCPAEFRLSIDGFRS